ncbi:MAG: LacI family DNA-binding transcriptional regulator [Hyphomicrobiales bacterium]|nr:LacI family DNA-binding transcriptional regulator [Hyphomicrobiales bacterium]
MAATIRDVAKRAGVSVATVSRLVNDTGRVRDETAERVRAAIADLGFRPNAVGRSLSTAHTRSLGIVIPSLSNPVFADAVAGINAEARAAGYTLMFTSTDYAPEEELRTVSALLEYRVDGLILTVADPADNPVLDLLQAAGVPYVLIYNQPCPRNHPTVTVDNVAAGREVALALAALGHRRLGMVSGTFTASDRAAARRDGFLAGCAEAGLPAPRVLEVDFVTPHLDRVLAPVYGDRAAAPTALFCSNDLLAISVIGALGRLGLKVPGDVSVIGFDGIAVGTHLHPTLATVIQPSHGMGRAATRQLLDRLAGEDRPATEILPHTLRLGESAGPAAKPSPADLQNPHQPIQRRSPS